MGDDCVPGLFHFVTEAYGRDGGRPRYDHDSGGGLLARRILVHYYDSS